MRSKIKIIVITISMLMILFYSNKLIKSKDKIIEEQKNEILRLEMLKKEIYELFTSCVESQD